jgi:tRNA threonylcarbamoyladenosine biosynthesis protein TsaB
MAYIVSLETSSDICSVAIHQNGKLISTCELHIPQSHASKLALLIREAIKLAGITPSMLDAVAVSSGPGSYTGLRIGVSTAKGLCYATGASLIPVNTLDLLAYQVATTTDVSSFLCPMIDARRMEVYCQVVDINLNRVMPIQSLVVDAGSFDQILNTHEVVFFGDGSDKCRSVIQHHHAKFIGGIYPSASALGVIAYERLMKNQTAELVAFEPFYLKQFEAKTSLRQ